MNSVSLMRAMALANAMANHRLHHACASLSGDDYGARRTSFFPSLHLTLTHIVLVDWFYVDGLERGGRGRAVFADEEPFRTFPEVASAQRAVDERLLAFVHGLRDDTALDETVTLQFRAGPAEERVGNVLLHLFVHQIHHRGQAHAMLSGTPVAPPQLDEFFMDVDAPLNAPERAAVARH